MRIHGTVRTIFKSSFRGAGKAVPCITSACLNSKLGNPKNVKLGNLLFRSLLIIRVQVRPALPAGLSLATVKHCGAPFNAQVRLNSGRWKQPRLEELEPGFGPCLWDRRGFRGSDLGLGFGRIFELRVNRLFGEGARRVKFSNP